MMLIALTLLACDGERDLRYRESLELLGINGDGALIDARFRWDNAGMLAGRSEATFDWIYRKAEPIHYGHKALPDGTRHSDDGLEVSGDSLLRDGDNWLMRLRDEELGVQLQLEPWAPPLATGRWDRGGRTWEVDAPVMSGRLRGFVRSGSREALVDGRGVLLRQRGDDPPEYRGADRTSVFVLGDDVSIGVHQVGADAYAWALARDVLLPTEDVVLKRTPQGFAVDLRPAVDLVVQVKARRQRLRSDPWDDLTRPERWLLSKLVGDPVRVTRGGVATLVTDGAPATYPAITVAVNYR
jgi:hypothetical protein